MSDHDQSYSESQELCDALLSVLAGRIPSLRTSQSERWCGFFEEGKRRFAYVNHRKRMNRIEVWFLGEPEELSDYSASGVELRSPTTGGFGRQFQARMFLDNTQQVNEVANLLVDVSYRLSR